MKWRVALRSLLFSLVLAVFPVASGVIAVVGDLDALQSAWLQGSFMLLSLLVPAIVLAMKKIHPREIGFTRAEKEGLRTALYFFPVIAAKTGYLVFGVEWDPSHRPRAIHGNSNNMEKVVE